MSYTIIIIVIMVYVQIITIPVV